MTRPPGCFLSVDLEDYKHATLLQIGARPDHCGPEATERGVRAVTDVLAAVPGDPRITFFTTGHVARLQPGLIAGLVGQGHEIGCHSDLHENIWDMTRDGFRADLARAGEAIAKAAGRPPRGFRAPNFSIDDRCPWALEVLAEAGYTYDSSLLGQDRRDAAAPADRVDTAAGPLWEFPVYRGTMAGRGVRVIGGTFFRLLPVGTILRLMRESAERGFTPLVYLHASDIDPRFEAVTMAEMAGLPWPSRLKWRLRQAQWALGGKGAAAKLSAVLKAFPNLGPMGEAVPPAPTP